MATDGERVARLQAELQEAEAGLKRVAAGALDMEAARQKTMALWERRERAQKRLSALNAGTELGEELKRALSPVRRDLPAVLARMDRERFRGLVRLVLRRVAVVAKGEPRNRTGEVTSYEFTPEFQEFWLTHSTGLVELGLQ